ncbi:MAG: UPF0058 family protein [Thermoplasmatota archaeon]
MHKDELLQLHSLLCQLKRYLDESGLPLQGEFAEYDALEVSPQHIHKSKTDHKRAVFLLGKGLSQVVMQGNPDHQARLRERFLRLATAAEAEEDEEDRDQTVAARERDRNLPAFALAALGH